MATLILVSIEVVADPFFDDAAAAVAQREADALFDDDTIKPPLLLLHHRSRQKGDARLRGMLGAVSAIVSGIRGGMAAIGAP